MATFTVTTASDAVNPAGLSLREALASADANPGADTIYFAPILNETTIVLTQGELTTASDVTIDGGDLEITIDANNQSRVLNISSGTVTLGGLIITGGAADGAGGGGIYAEADTRLDLTLTAVINNQSLGSGGGIQANGVLNVHFGTVSGNRVSGDLASGGGIAGHEVTLTESRVTFNDLLGNSLGGGGIKANSVNLARSTVNENRASGSGGYGGEIYATGDVTLFNSTVADNGAGLPASSGDPNDPRGGAGGIFSVGGVVSLTDSTLTGNYAALLGGGVSAQSIKVANSIVVGNAAKLLGPDINGRVTESNGHNLFGSDVDGNVPGDLESVAPETVFARTAPIPGTTVSSGVLGLNGGFTETVALLDASTNPALGRGEGIADITTDQRGEPRPLDRQSRHRRLRTRTIACDGGRHGGREAAAGLQRQRGPARPVSRRTAAWAWRQRPSRRWCGT